MGLNAMIYQGLEKLYQMLFFKPLEGFGLGENGRVKDMCKEDFCADLSLGFLRGIGNVWWVKPM